MFYTSIPLLLSFVFLFLSKRHSRGHSLRYPGIALLCFIVSVIFLELCYPFTHGLSNMMDFIFSAVFYFLPILIALYVLSRLSENRYSPIKWSLIISIPTFLFGVAFLLGLDPAFYTIYAFAFNVFLVAFFVRVLIGLYKLRKRTDEQTTTGGEGAL